MNKIDFLGIGEHNNGLNGMVAVENISKGDTILYIPHEMYLTVASVEETEISQKMKDSDIFDELWTTKSNVLMAVHLLWERRDEVSV